MTYEKALKIVEAHKETEEIQRDKRRVEMASKLVGTCWKYDNSSSYGRMWLYMKVVAADGMYIVEEKYQLWPSASYHQIDIDSEKDMVHESEENGLLDGYQRITEAEFQRAKKRILGKLRA